MKLNLNGTWDFYPNGDDERFDVTVPTWWDSLPQTTGYPKLWENGLRHAIYRKTVVLEEASLHEDLFLHIGALATLGKAYVNGVCVSPASTKGYLMTLLPYDLDINDAAHAGENEIAIEVWSVKQLPEDALAPEEGPDRLLFPFGTENIVGRVGIGGDIYIESLPKLRIDDIQIIPDLKKNADPCDDELTVNITVVNNTSTKEKLQLKTAVTPWRDDATIELAPVFESVEVGAHSSVVVSSTTAWPNAHYWSRKDPFLYSLTSEILRGTDSVHSVAERFGFREFYRVGDKYYLNGIKIRLRGDSLCLLNQGNRDLINEIGDAYGVILDDNHASDAMGAAWIDAYQHANANIIRNHIRSIPSDSLFTHADETGMLIEEETAFWNPGSVSNVSLTPPYYINYSDEAISYYCEWVERWVCAYRNHPSIILWSTTNEAWNPNDATVLIPPLQEAVAKNDPSRMVINDGFNQPITNEDSRHYFGGYPSGMTSAPDIYDLYQIDSELPLGAGEEFSVSTAGIPQYSEDGTIKDIYHGRLNGNPDTISRADFGREVGRVTRGVRTTRMANWKPFCLSMFIYDNIEKYIPLDQGATQNGLNPKMLLRPQFDPTATGSDRWIEGDGYEYFANSYADVAAFDKEFDKEPRLGLPHHIYQLGTTSKRTILLYNDEEIDGTILELEWKVTYYNTQSGISHEVETGSDTVEVEHGEFREHEITLHVPGEVESYESKLILTLSIRKKGALKFQEENFLGWIGRPAPAKIAVSRPTIDLGTVDWVSRSVKHCIHLSQEGGALSEKWNARLADDAQGSISIERMSGNLRHEQEQFFTLNVAGLTSGQKYTGLIVYTGENGDTAEVRISFIAGTTPDAKAASNKALGATVRVSSSSEELGWTSASLVDGQFEADYNHFGWSSDALDHDHHEWVILELSAPEHLEQIVLSPRGQNPGGTIAEAFHGEGEGVGGVLEFAAGHKAIDPNQGQGFPVDFTISVSQDGVSWNIVARCNDYPLPDNGKARAFDFAGVDNVRFIKIDATKLRANPNDANKYSLQLVEIAAYEDTHMPTIPATPTNVTAAAKDHDTVISWTLASDGRSPIQGSKLTLRNNSGEVIPLEVQGDTSTLLVNDVPAGEWNVEVRSFNAIGESTSGTSDSFHVGRQKANTVSATLMAPNQPRTELLTDSNNVIVSWAAATNTIPAGTGGYNIRLVPIADERVSLPTRIGWVSGTGTTSMTFSDVAKGTYYATVQASDQEDQLSSTSQQSDPIIVANVPTQPNKPGVTSEGSDMKVTWRKPSNGGTPIVSNILTLRNLTENTATTVKASAGEEEKIISSLEAGNYTVSVIAVNAIGMSTESSPSLPCLIK